MAKSKKKSGNLGLILKVVTLVFAVAAFCMAFLTCVKFVTEKGDVVNEFTGFQEMFGYTKKTTSLIGTEVSTKYLAFGFMAVVTFLLPVVGAVLSFLNNKIARFVGAALMIVGAVLMFLLPQFAVLATVDGELTVVTVVLDNLNRSLGLGAILGGVFAALGGLVSGYAALTNK